jgi:hypothetical protein
MDNATRSLIEALHHAPGKCVLVLTGGGTTAAAMLLEVPGASRTILEVLVPYDEHSFGDLLGHRPEQFCSAPTTREMALRAYDRARWLAPGEAVVGVGCTASLATDRPKRGEHRFHVAIHRSETLTWSLTLLKGARDRSGEEAILDAVLLNALAETIGIPERLTVPLLPGEKLEADRLAGTDPLSAFLRGDLATICVEVDGQVRADRPPPPLLLAGAFNPLHEGHCAMAEAAARMVGLTPAFELSVTNADKPSLSDEEVRLRMRQFLWKAPLWLARSPTFVEKTRLHPGTVFVVGADTAARIVAARYYGNSEERMNAALEEIRSRNCRFLVAGRVDEGGTFIGLENLAIGPAHRDLFQALPESAFRLDISSTSLRGQGRAHEH